MDNINPTLPEHHNRILWCVYGPDCFPTMFCCVIKTASRNPTIWGYSVYKRSPGFRTLGREVVGEWIESNNAKFFATQDDAFEYLRALTSPKCDVSGNKIKKPTKREEARVVLKRLGVKTRTALIGEERERILDAVKDLKPIDSGTSLHWWNDTYLVDGKTYDIGGALNSKEVELVELVEEIG